MSDPFEQKSNPISVDGKDIFVDAIIYYVDTINNVFDAISKDQIRHIKKCQYLEINPDGSGQIHHPSAGNCCIVRICPDQSQYLERIYTPSNVNENGIPTINLGPNANFMPGDKVWLAKGGAFLQLLRAGLTKIGVTPVCQMIFMKLESYTRWISRNIEILASGFRFYSVNEDGVTSTRLSFFLTDAMNTIQRDQSSNASDFEIQVAKNAITIFFGPKDKDGNRINAGELSLETTGDVYLRQYDASKPTAKTIIRRVKYTADGCSEDTIYGNKNEIFYQKNITRLKAAIDGQSSPFVPKTPLQCPMVNVSELIVGNYTLTVDGDFHLTAGNNANIAGNNIFQTATVSHAVQCTGSFMDSQINA
jgi:hypothetical protein